MVTVAATTSLPLCLLNCHISISTCDLLNTGNHLSCSCYSIPSSRRLATPTHFVEFSIFAHSVHLHIALRSRLHSSCSHLPSLQPFIIFAHALRQSDSPSRNPVAHGGQRRSDNRCSDRRATPRKGAPPGSSIIITPVSIQILPGRRPSSASDCCWFLW